jgi:hypothetical protein
MDEDLRQSIRDVTQELRQSLKVFADTLKPDTSPVPEKSNSQQVAAPEVTNSSSSIAQAQPTSTPSDLTGIHGSIEGIKKDLGWHARVGWGIAGVLSFTLLGLFTWYLPKQQEEAFTKAKLEIRNQIQPLLIQIAQATAAAELGKPSANKQLGPALRKYGVQPLSGTNAQLNYETVRALALKARDQQIVTNRSDVNEVGRSLMDIALGSRSSPAAAKAWSAAVELVNYATFLNQSSSSVVDLVNEEARKLGLRSPVVGLILDFKPGTLRDGIPVRSASKTTIDGQNGLTVEGFNPTVPSSIAGYINKLAAKTDEGNPAFYVVHGDTLDLDGLDAKNVIFRDCVVRYNGGGFKLTNVQFDNCTFSLPITQPGKQVANAILGSPGISELTI